MNPVIYRLRSLFVSVISTTLLVVMMFLLSATLSYGNVTQAQASPLTPPTFYGILRNSPQELENKAQDAGEDVAEMTQKKLESAASKQGSPDLDPASNPATKKVLEDAKDRTEQRTQGQRGREDAVKAQLGGEAGAYKSE